LSYSLGKAEALYESLEARIGAHRVPLGIVSCKNGASQVEVPFQSTRGESSQGSETVRGDASDRAPHPLNSKVPIVRGFETEAEASVAG
jgi:hypothetical protein